MKTPEPISPKLRKLIIATLPEEAATYDTPPEPRFFYIPSRHERALDLDKMLVVGIRGAGKSVWWAALQSAPHRERLAASLGQPHVSDRTIVTAGFGGAQAVDRYPDRDIMEELLRKGIEGRAVWRTIMVWQTWGNAERNLQRMSWLDRARWVLKSPEVVARGFADYEVKLKRDGKTHLVLFDAIDRSANDWRDLSSLLRGLLQNLLDFRTHTAIRAKAFVRPDMLDDPQAVSFPDASKVLNSKVDLQWDVVDLYSLLWQHLGNADSNEFRKQVKARWKIDWVASDDEVYSVPEELRAGVTQRDLFHAISGPWMGANHRRGYPYSWLPSHLGDSRRQVSPRSFLSALRTAAEDTGKHRPFHPFPLHYESIKRGVQSASQIRVKEVKEDSPWIATAMEPLNGIAIPCKFDEIERLWDEADVLDSIKRDLGIKPRHESLAALRDELVTLGLFFMMDDGRVNMPDVYRVGFGLGRRGGVKPIK